MSPKNRLCLHVCLLGGGVVVGEGINVGTEVTGDVGVGLSQHPQMSPGVWQGVIDALVEPDVIEVAVMVAVIVGSRQPNQPGS